MRQLIIAVCLLLITDGRSAGQSDQPFRFVHVSDLRLTAAGSLDPLRKLVTDVNAMSSAPAFVVVTGNITNAGIPAEFARFTEGTRGLACPVYCAPGSLDVRSAGLGKEPFVTAFSTLYSSFDKNGVHCVTLDSTISQHGGGHIDSAQLKWLESDLKKLKKDTPVLVFLHHPIGRETAPIDNEEQILRLIAPHNVVAIFSAGANTHWRINGIDCFAPPILNSPGVQAGEHGRGGLPYNMVEVDPAKIVVTPSDSGKPVTRMPRDRSTAE